MDATGLAVDSAGFGQPVVGAAVLGADGPAEDFQFFLGEEFGAHKVVDTVWARGIESFEVADKYAAVEPAAGVEVSVVDGGNGALIELVQGGTEEFHRDYSGDASGDDPADAAVASGCDSGFGEAFFFNDEDDVGSASTELTLVGKDVAEPQVAVVKQPVFIDHTGEDALVEFSGCVFGDSLFDETYSGEDPVCYRSIQLSGRMSL